MGGSYSHGIGRGLAAMLALLVFAPGPSPVFAGVTTDRPVYYDEVTGVYYKALGTRRHDVSDFQHTALANEPRFDAVGEVLATDSLGSFRCSGTLISSTHVLTAAHCMDGGDGSPFGPGPSAITFNLPSAPGLIGDISNVNVHPSWNGNLANGKDIAVFQLTAPVVGVTPAQRYQASFGSELGHTATSVGYGRTGTGLTGDTIASGTRRAGNNVLDAFGGAFPFFWSNDLALVDFDNPNNLFDSVMGSFFPIALEYNIAPGDSGGGAFVEVDGTHYLAGVHSIGWSLDGFINSDYGDGGGFTRVSLFNDWIDSVSPAFTLVLGDANNDMQVTGADLLAVQQNFGNVEPGAPTGLLLGDANNDGSVTGADLITVQQEFGAGVAAPATALPEPGTILMLALAGMFSPRRRLNLER